MIEKSRGKMPLTQRIPANDGAVLRRWVTLGVALLILGGVIAYFLFREHNRIEAQERDRLATQAKVVAANLGHQLYAADQALLGIRRDLRFWKAQKDGKALANRNLRALGDAMPGVRTFLILDAEGTAVFSSREELVGRSFAERDYFKAARQHKDPAVLHVNPPFKTVLDVFALNVARMIPGPKGEFNGLVSATIDPEYFTILLGSVLYSPDMWTGLAHGDGRQFLMVPDREGAAGADLAGPGSLFTRHRESGREATVLAGIFQPTGGECLAAQHTIRPDNVPLDKPLVVAVGRDLRSIHADWRRLAVAQSGFFGLLALAAGIGVHFYQRRQREYSLEAVRHVAELRASKDLLGSVLNTMPVGVWIVDANGRILEGNPAGLRIWGGAKFVGPDQYGEYKGWWRSTGKPVAPEEWGAARAIRNGETSLDEEIEIECFDGTRKIILNSAVPLRNDRGEITGAIILNTDVTARRQMEDALRETDRRFREMLENVQLVAVMLDAQGNVTFCNRYLLDLTGWKREEVEGKSWFDRFIPPEADVQRIFLENIAKGAIPPHYQNDLLTRSGGRRSIAWSNTVLRDAQGNVVGTTSIGRDITDRLRSEEERRKLERQVQRAQKLESLGVLAGGIAHDFNNLLMVVLGHAEMALKEIAPMSPARESLAEILTAGRRAADLCRQMLAYAGKASFALERVGLSELVGEMAHLLKSAISKKAILNLSLERGLPPIQADPSQIRQIAMNLIINASEAIGDRSGVITVSTGATRCDGEYLAKAELYEDLSPGLYVHLEVADTGGGIDAETRARIFEPFFTTKFTGRGLGLSAVLGIVRAHRGALKLSTEPGKRTTFRILFPALAEGEDATRITEPSASGDWRGKGTILLVDDEESLLALGARMLEQLGFDVLTAADGRAAVELYRERGGTIDLVLMDLTMPHMDGVEAFGELRRLNPDVRVVLASGYSEEDVAARFGGKGLAGILQKPYALDKLKDLLEGLLPCQPVDKHGE